MELRMKPMRAIGWLLLICCSVCIGSDPATWIEHTAPSRPWQYVVLHHSAAEAGSVESIDADHRTRKDASGNPWRGIGYHFVIGNGRGMRDGQVQSTFRWKDQTAGAHAGEARYNEEGIGICLIGNFQSEPPTEKQLDSLAQLLTQLQGDWQIPEERVITHGQVKATACPGRQFVPALKRSGVRLAGATRIESGDVPAQNSEEAANVQR